MHGLGTIAYLNQEAIDKSRAKSQDAIEAKEEAPTFTIEDIENAREEALEEGQDNGYDSGCEAGYDSGYEEGFDMGKEEVSDVASLLDHLTKWGIEPLNPFTAIYDAAIKAIVFHQEGTTVVLNNGLRNS